MKYLLVFYHAGFPEDTSCPTVCALYSWLFYLCYGNGRMYSSYDGCMMAEKFILMTVSYSQIIKQKLLR